MEAKTAVLDKLMQARMALMQMSLRKSGRNTYAGYDYYELSDFLPQTLALFTELKMAGYVAFDADIARLTITDLETGQEIYVTSPMGSANLKGCHDIQNIGAVQTYQRRYLWMAALELVENDALDATTNPANHQAKPANATQKGSKNGKAAAAPQASPEILADAKLAAEQGTQAYTEFWNGLNPDDQRAIGERRHADFWTMAQDADSFTDIPH